MFNVKEIKNALLENTPLYDDVINIIMNMVKPTTFEVGKYYMHVTGKVMHIVDKKVSPPLFPTLNAAKPVWNLDGAVSIEMVSVPVTASSKAWSEISKQEFHDMISPTDNGQDYPDGPWADGWEERSGQK